MNPVFGIETMLHAVYSIRSGHQQQKTVSHPFVQWNVCAQQIENGNCVQQKSFDFGSIFMSAKNMDHSELKRPRQNKMEGKNVILNNNSVMPKSSSHIIKLQFHASLLPIPIH